MSPPFLRMSGFPSLLSKCLLLDKSPFKFLSTCSSFYLAASELYIYFLEWLNILFLANGLFSVTGGSQNWLQRLSLCVYKASFRFREMLKEIVYSHEDLVFLELSWGCVFMGQVIQNNIYGNQSIHHSRGYANKTCNFLVTFTEY